MRALVYDPLGRLFQVSSPTAGTRRLLYDGDALVAEYDGSNNLLRRYVHGVGADVPLIWYEEATPVPLRRYLHADHQGSIIAVADAGGNAIAINRYDEYGIPGAGNSGTFQYTGQTWLAELGMYYYKARIYSPTLGRFLQTDPIGYEDQINLYTYVGNDPVNHTDPTGKQCAFVCYLFGGPVPVHSASGHEVGQYNHDAAQFGLNVAAGAAGAQAAMYASAIGGTAMAEALPAAAASLAQDATPAVFRGAERVVTNTFGQIFARLDLLWRGPETRLQEHGPERWRIRASAHLQPRRRALTQA